MLKSSCLHFILCDWSPLSFVFVWLCHHLLIVVSVCLCHNQVPHIIIKHLVKNGSFPDFSTAWVSLNWPRSWLSKWPTCSSFTTKYETSKVFLKTSSCSLLSLNSRGHWFPVGTGVMEFDPIFSCTKPGLHYAVLILHDQ